MEKIIVAFESEKTALRVMELREGGGAAAEAGAGVCSSNAAPSRKHNNLLLFIFCSLAFCCIIRKLLCFQPGGRILRCILPLHGHGILGTHHRSHLTLEDTDEITFQHTVDITLDMTVHSDPTGRRQRLRLITL